jgi:hypothetical protein
MDGMSLEELRRWVRAEYELAREAQRVARRTRTAEGNPHEVFHVSATARVCALGQVLERLTPDPLPGPSAPMTPHGRRGDL